MNFSGELAVWIVFCLVGGVTAALSARYAWLNHRAATILSTDPEFTDGTAHFREQAVCLVVFWVGFLVAGVVASIDTPPERPLGVTVFGSILRYVLIGSVGLLSYMTAKNYLFARRRWMRLRKQEGGGGGGGG